MPSWQQLQALGAEIGETLPGTWILSPPPPLWMVILTRSDSQVRILIDDHLIIVAEVSLDGPLPPMGTLPSKIAVPPKLMKFRTRHRDGTKIASLIAQRLNLS